ncbi:MAG: sensor histidine kinase [Anaerolineales bacterium]|nr:sensor histidine kinase [Anaerolineales bacterium]
MEVHNDLDIPRLLRTASWMWLGYLAALLFIDWQMYPRLGLMLIYYLVNGCAALVFMVLAYWNGLRLWLGRIYLPMMLLIITILPLMLNHLLMPRLPQGPMSNAEGMALRQLPVLFIALVLTAWQYRLAGVILFAGITAMVELLTVILLTPLAIFLTNPRPLPLQPFIPVQLHVINIFLILALVRTISFVAVGAFVSQLMNRLQAQQRSLQEANARLTHYASTLESLTASRERNRLAHELHDTLAHSLTGISVQLETTRAYWDVDRDKARELLNQSLAATRHGIDETRRALKSLRASPLEELGLLLALRELAETTTQRGGLDLNLALPETLPSLSPDVEQCIYRVTQEILENAVAHAGAKGICLHLAESGGSLRLVARDDGSGFDIEAADKTGHFGLLGMRERARLVGGTLEVTSQPGKGTTITLTIGAAL